MSDSLTYSTTQYGDAALLVEYTGGDSERRWRAAQALGAALDTSAPGAVEDVVATYATVYVAYDAASTSATEVGRLVDAHAHGAAPPVSGRTIDLVARYGGEDGPDLPEVAGALGMSEEAFVALHRSDVWTIRFLAAPVGAPMMEGPRFPQELARRGHPRIRVPSGSIAVSGQQTVIYPVQAPGGWQLIGRTPDRLVDPGADPMTCYTAGDRVRFA